MSDQHARDIYEITRPDGTLLTLYTLRALFTGPAFPFVFVPLFFKYETLRYRFDEEGVTMAWGILWRREIYLTYARIQDIHLSRGVLERWLGLATINIQTAAGSASSEMSIVGLGGYERLRDFLYSKMRGARFGGGEETETAQPAGTTGDEGDDVLDLLTDIRDELRRLRQRLEHAGP